MFSVGRARALARKVARTRSWEMSTAVLRSQSIDAHARVLHPEVRTETNDLIKGMYAVERRHP